jgi:flagellar hook-associated protein 3 FlgL
MPGRVTQNMMNAQMLRNLNYNLSQMDKLQNQMATGRRINKPSDDPVGISFSMRYRSELSANDQYEKNVDNAISWLDFTDAMLDQATQIIQRVRELAVNGANSTNPPDAMNAIRSEIIQLREQMVTVANSQFNGKYIFNGEKTDVKPYVDDAANPAASAETDGGKIHFEIGVGVLLAVNVTGNEVFGNPGDADNIFQVMDDLIAALGASDYQAVGATLDRIDSRMNSFLAIRSDIGAKTNRIELAQNRLSEISINLQTLQSKTEDADLAEVITNLKTYENIYQSSLSVGARIIRPSLVDFLK